MRFNNITFLTTFVFTLLLFFIFINLFKLQQQERLNLITSETSINISRITNKIFNQAILGADILVGYLEENNGHIDSTSLTKLSERILKKYPYIDTIGIAPDGILSYFYPLETNEPALGHDLTKDISRSIGAKLQISNKFITLGPIRLIQNNKSAFIFRTPYYNESAVFSGYVSIIISLDLVKREILEVIGSTEKYNFELTGFDPDNNEKNIIISNKRNQESLISKTSVNILDSNWDLTLYSNDTMYDQYFNISMFFVILWIIIYNISLRIRIYMSRNIRIKTAAYVDTLTGIPNRNAFDNYINNISQEKDNLKYILAIFDIDNFKKINDSYGHIFGDCVLREFANVLQKNLRTNDYLFRWGGEEFILMMKGADLGSGFFTCQRLRKVIESTNFFCEEGNVVRITTSIGYTSFNKNIPLADNLKKADLGLYKAKTEGKNKVCTIV